jgi:hypothetical protein
MSAFFCAWLMWLRPFPLPSRPQKIPHSFTLKVKRWLHTCGALVYTVADCGEKWGKMEQNPRKNQQKYGKMGRLEQMF